jgi:hypothetical protein
MSSWWEEVRNDTLAQGDYLPACLIPFLPTNYGESEDIAIEVREANLIVVTQSCDLANGKAETVALCRVSTIREFQQLIPQYQVTKNLDPIRQGRMHSFHLLSGFESSDDNLAALVVDFRQLYCLPIEYLTRHAAEVGNRTRLKSPYLEHFSQALARFFMRVGLPSDIPPYR